MPQVPRYGERQIGVAPIPTVRHPTDVPIESVAAIPHPDISGLVKAANDVYDREVAKANQIAITDAEAKAADLETRILYDPEKGVLRLKGRDSLDGRQQMEEMWKKGVDEIGKELHNDTQRLAFNRMAGLRLSDINSTVTRHIATQLEAYDDQVTEGLIAKEGNAAASAAVKGVSLTDITDRSTMAIGRQRAAIVGLAKRKGLPPEKTEQLLAAQTSNTHMAVIRQLSANEDDITAKAYFEENKDQLTAEDLAKATEMTDAGSLRGESQRVADSIYSKHKNNLDKARVEIKKIKDPALRDAVDQRVQHEFQVDKAIERERQNDLYLNATNLIEPYVKSGKPFLASAVVPAGIWSQLDLQQRQALERRAGDRENDPSVWHDFLELEPKQLGSLNKSEFEARYWSHFNNETRTRAELMWAAARDQVRTGKLDAKMAADETFKGLVRMALGNMDKAYQKKEAKDLTPAQYQFYTDFTIEAIRRKEQQETKDGKAMNRIQMQEILDDLVKERVFIDRGFRKDPFRLPAGNISKDEKNRAYIPWDDIPEDKRQEMDRLIRQNGGLTSRRKIERLYAARIMEDRALFSQIMKEK